MATKKTSTKRTTKATGAKTTASKPKATANKPKAPAKKPATTSATKTAPAKQTAKKVPANKKLSMLDAAVKILSESDEPMTTKALIEQMAAKGYWSSPNGKTPAQTLYAAILRETQKKGAEARFVKADRGLFKLA